MEQLPIYLNVKGKRVLVAGGTTVAARKAEMALRAGARVQVFAPDLCGDFDELLKHAGFSHQARWPEAADINGCLLVYSATEDEPRDIAVQELARAAGVLVNVADRPAICDFAMPAILDRSPLVVAIGTAGSSPILGRMLKSRLEALIPASYGRLARFVGTRRGALSKALSDGGARRRFWERVLEGPIAEMVLAGQDDRAEQALDAAIAAADDLKPTGEVYLVGAGPGDVDLLTFRAHRLMQKADVVLYDNLVGDGVLNLVRRDAERIYVGKRRNNHALPQEDISGLLVKLAKEGKRVLRLKGGDPFIFGRGGEEIEMLADHGIPFQVVPGITAAAGCAAYAGIPLTHRDHAQSCLFVTGHGKDGFVDLDWTTLIQPHQTVAIYMGLAQLPGLMAEFITRGANPDLPAAVVDNGTRANQRVVTGTLATLADKVAAAELRGPTIIIVGTVITLRDKLGWFDAAPAHPESNAQKD